MRRERGKTGRMAYFTPSVGENGLKGGGEEATGQQCSWDSFLIGKLGKEHFRRKLTNTLGIILYGGGEILKIPRVLNMREGRRIAYFNRKWGKWRELWNWKEESYIQPLSIYWPYLLNLPFTLIERKTAFVHYHFVIRRSWHIINSEIQFFFEILVEDSA